MKSVLRPDDAFDLPNVQDFHIAKYSIDIIDVDIIMRNADLWLFFLQYRIFVYAFIPMLDIGLVLLRNQCYKKFRTRP